MIPPVYARSYVSNETLRFHGAGFTKDLKKVYLRSDVHIPEGVLHAFIRLQNYTKQEFDFICRHHAQAISLFTLPKEILKLILFYARTHFHILRITCKTFSHLKPVIPLRIFKEILLVNGSFNEAKYIHAHFKVPFNSSWDHHVAALGGSIDMLKWLKEIKCPGSAFVCSSAAENGHLHVINWAYRNRYELDRSTVSYVAAKNGYLPILKWLYKHNQLDPVGFKGAILGNKREVLIWLKKKKVPLDEMLVEQAISLRNIDLIKWLADNGAIKTPKACLIAADDTRLEILIFLIENDFPHDLEKLLLIAIRDVQPNTIKWLSERINQERVP